MELLPSFTAYLAVVGFFVVFFAGRSVVFAGAGALFLRTRFAQARRIYLRAFDKGQLRSELRSAIVIVLFDAVAIGLSRHLKLMDLAPASPASFARTFVLLAVWTEVWFFFSHWALHQKPLYFLHAQHHVAKVTSPLTSMSFSLAERAILLVGINGFAILSSKVMPISIAGLTAYFVFNYALNVWGHLNVELMPAWFTRSWFGRAFITTTYHSMHHARYVGHYGLFTRFLDRAFGTGFADYEAVHERVAHQQGLKTLGERIAVPAPPAVAAPTASAAR